MLLLRVQFAGTQLLAEIRVHFGDDTGLHVVKSVDLGEDAGDGAMHFQDGGSVTGHLPIATLRTRDRTIGMIWRLATSLLPRRACRKK